MGISSLKPFIDKDLVLEELFKQPGRILNIFLLNSFLCNELILGGVTGGAVPKTKKNRPPWLVDAFTGSLSAPTPGGFPPGHFIYSITSVCKNQVYSSYLIIILDFSTRRVYHVLIGGQYGTYIQS